MWILLTNSKAKSICSFENFHFLFGIAALIIYFNRVYIAVAQQFSSGLKIPGVFQYK